VRRLFAILLACSSVSLAPAQPPAPTAPEILPDSPVYGVYPIAYRDIIMKFLESRLLDAGSARIEWGKPQQGTITTPEGKISGYAVVITVNARNKFGMYTGKQKYRLLIRNGEIVHAGRG
jgi:hypothetical protein